MWVRPCRTHSGVSSHRHSRAACLEPELDSPMSPAPRGLMRSDSSDISPPSAEAAAAADETSPPPPTPPLTPSLLGTHLGLSLQKMMSVALLFFSSTKRHRDQFCR
ncbi:unnamed protein product [Pleuronectes platessa]|uniref:Uncharacterized protein n=1 Tax=Pleuronectes platessa TaxID=8262 RepID=A0A9N7TML3_PLEPL|nr:unnamed protein product [Pleuronectes platessa]